jgi:hypothetical protein
VEEVGRGRWKKFTAAAGRSSPRWVEEVGRGTQKATILHMIYHYPAEKNAPPRMSRHYYDIYAMVDSPIYKRALENIALLKTVAEHKALFFKANWAHYEEATPAGLRLLPREDQLGALKNDYRQMQQMFFEEPPTFDQIIEKLRDIEKEINRI